MACASHLVESGKELSSRAVRKTYLITYSEANYRKFPTREAVARAVLESFSGSESKVKVKHWVCSKEPHEKTSGFHYHMAVKFDGNRRWKTAKNFLLDNYDISVHFSEEHDNYFTAYCYAIKYDKEALHSENHPDLMTASNPKTGKAIASWRRASKEKRSEKEDAIGAEKAVSSSKRKPMKRVRLTNLDVSSSIVEKEVKTITELMTLAKEQSDEGKTDILRKGQKGLSELIDSTWKMHMAPAAVKRQNAPWMHLIEKSLKEQCVEGRQSLWFKCAVEVLKNNDVNRFVFAAAIRELLKKRRGKNRNVIIVGPANCGKTFLLNPLNKIFSTFTNPATTSYAWVGAELAEVIFLNDFRWTPEILAWKDFLLLLEGQTLHLATPKSHFAKDILFDRDTPIFATSKEPIEFVGKRGAVDEKETEMMNVRWNIFSFKHQISKKDQKDLLPCARCFAQLVMLGSEED